MVDRINKALFKMSSKERAQVLETMEQIKKGKISGLDLKKLQGEEHVYRVRRGSFRITFFMRNPEQIKIIDVERRSDNTYKNL